MWLRQNTKLSRADSPSETGASMLEFAILVFLLSISCIAATEIIGDKASEKITITAECMDESSELCNRSEEPTGVMRNSGESGNSAGGETSLAGGTVGSSREFGEEDEAEFSGGGPGGSQPSTQNGNWIP